MDGSILTSKAISEVLGDKILINPFNEKMMNPNSYNLTLGDEIVQYDLGLGNEMIAAQNDFNILDVKKDNPTVSKTITSDGFILEPGTLYLGTTVEYTETYYPFVPMIEGRSSLARLGLSIHITAGFGDVGYRGKWTLEMTVVHPIRIYAGMEIAQIYYHKVYGDKPKPYDGKYQNQLGPVSSKIHKEF